MTAPFPRKYAHGAEVGPQGVNFRVFAPTHSQVAVIGAAGTQLLALQAEGNGFWSATLPEARSGDRYHFRLDGEPPDLPDPAARFLPDCSFRSTCRSRESRTATSRWRSFLVPTSGPSTA